eukprot:CAMPEP_0194578186 /NCGR_PEP_ID=MMETSP0292-20121207/12689_1 /TAXON_ID=39354 /ORGANISM="Heterosigma akashiwo, Strain CCMP2393" /LENGTH=182 /DNA_ID=CAMNT_0039430759 /DNA_START=293 /DNA_END=842 /DNA_ORIENTATION=+
MTLLLPPLFPLLLPGLSCALSSPAPRFSLLPPGPARGGGGGGGGALQAPAGAGHVPEDQREDPRAAHPAHPERAGPQLQQRFPDTYNPDAYTRLILEALRGSQATFVREDELRESWKIFDPLLKELEEKQVVPTPYDYGSRGPPEADATRLRVGYQWNADYVWTRPSAEAKAEAAAAGESKL